jgi:hypothetical protein
VDIHYLPLRTPVPKSPAGKVPSRSLAQNSLSAIKRRLNTIIAVAENTYIVVAEKGISCNPAFGIHCVYRLFKKMPVSALAMVAPLLTIYLTGAMDGGLHFYTSPHYIVCCSKNTIIGNSKSDS